MKIKNLKVQSILKRMGALGCTLVLVGSLTGCGSFIKEVNDETYQYPTSTTYVSNYYSVMTDDDIRNLPASVETLSLGFSNYVTDLSSLPETCPNLKNLSLNSCSGITDLSFIYRLHSLEKVTLNDIAGVSQELLDYLKSQGIEFYITEDDVVASEMIPQILDQIIEDGMTDEEKIQAIALYVSRHCKYKLFSADQSNEDPLSTTLLDGKGVCAGIAYTTNVLLRSAGINSYEAVSNSHAWNLVELDGKYYYLDVTNLGGVVLPKGFAQKVLESFGFGFGYMTDPSRCALTATKPYDNRSKVIIPQSLVEDIARGESEKTLMEKYGSSIPLQLIAALIVIVGVGLGVKGAKLGVEAIQDSRYRKRRRKEQKSTYPKKPVKNTSNYRNPVQKTKYRRR